MCLVCWCYSMDRSSTKQFCPTLRSRSKRMGIKSYKKESQGRLGGSYKPPIHVVACRHGKVGRKNKFPKEKKYFKS